MNFGQVVIDSVTKVEDIRKEHQGVLETAMTRAGQALGWKSRGLAKDTVRGGTRGLGGDGGTKRG